MLCGHYQVFSSSGELIYPTFSCQAIQEIWSKFSHFKDLYLGVWFFCADGILQFQPYWSAMLSHSITLSTYSHSQPCHSLFMRKVYICMVIHFFPSSCLVPNSICHWNNSLWIGKTVKLPLFHELSGSEFNKVQRSVSKKTIIKNGSLISWEMIIIKPLIWIPRLIILPVKRDSICLWSSVVSREAGTLW